MAGPKVRRRPRRATFLSLTQGNPSFSRPGRTATRSHTICIPLTRDVAFHPNAVEKLRAHQLPITCALYPKKGKRSFASTFLPGTKQIRFGPQGGLHEIQYAGAGFLHVRRQVYLDIQKKLQLPLCNEVFGDELIPFFMPMVQPQRDGHWYLAEDYSFCERARRTGYKIMADTSIRLWYIGSYPYGWEEAGREVERFNDYSYNFE